MEKTKWFLRVSGLGHNQTYVYKSRHEAMDFIIEMGPGYKFELYEAKIVEVIESEGDGDE